MIDAGETTPLVDLIRPDRPVTYGILKPGTNVEGGIPVIRVKDYPNGEIIQEDMLHTTPEIDAKYVRSHLLPGDLLLSIGGSVGRMAIVPPELEGANITQHTARLSFAEKVLTKYVMGVLEMPSLQHIMESQIKGVAQKGLNLADVKQFPIPVPSIGTQQRLVDIYDQSDKSKFVCSNRNLSRCLEILFKMIWGGQLNLSKKWRRKRMQIFLRIMSIGG